MSASSDPPRPTDTQSCEVGGCRVLVVEDNADISRLTTLLLRQWGFDVLAVSSGHVVVETARSFRPQFIILDIGLPVLDGYAVAELIRDDPVLSKVTIIAVSAYGPEVHPDRSGRAGFNYHLTKPVRLDDLLTLLNPRHG
jgi:CheY-like chemotaxis protein